MLLFNKVAFDDIIDGTSLTWYSPASYNELFGRPAGLLLHAFATSIAGTSPTLTVAVDGSTDNQNWTLGSAAISAQALTVGGTTLLQATWTADYFAFRRIRINLGGTSPQCQLRLSVVGRQ